MDNMTLCKRKSIYKSMYTVNRVHCMRICSSVCGKVLLDACAYEQESASTDALWTYVIVSVEEDTGQQVIELKISVAISDVLRCATGHSDTGYPVEDKTQ